MTPPRATLLPSGQVRVAVDEYADSELCKRIQGRTWGANSHHNAERAWLIPGTPEAIGQLRELLPSVVIEPEVKTRVDEVASWRGRVSMAKDGKRPVQYHYWPDDLISATPYQHQLEAHNVGRTVLEHSSAYGLWHDAGLGKTLTSLAIVGSMAAEGRLGEHPFVLVVCPSVVIGVWSKEAEKFARFPIRVLPLVGATAKRAATVLAAKADPFDGVTMFVTNYEALRYEVLLKALVKLQPDVMVCDEAHRLKAAGSEQSKAARKIGAKSIRIAATGTPTDTPLDWYGIFRWLDPEVFGGSMTAFKARYFITVPGGDNWDIVVGPQPEMFDELIGKAHSIAHACSKDEALDLPDRIDIDRTCELEPRARKAYDELRRDAIAMLDDGHAVVGQNGLTRLLRLQQITGGFLRKSEEEGGAVIQVSDAKLKLLKEELIDQLPSNHKIVVFARFTPEVDAILKLCRMFNTKAEPIGVDVIDGRVPMGPQRDAIIDDFQNSEAKRILVLQIKAAGIGITLHAAHHAIFYSLGASHIDHSQARDRIHRIGQDSKCSYTYLLGENTIDEKVVKVLREKRDISTLSLHQWRELLS